jgi:decaprenyl-phosphate phosphoribosyltransferase
VLLVLALGICLAVRPLLALVGAGYAGLTVSYTMFWRRVIILDLFAIAGGFVLRAVAGGVAGPVTLSRWFLIVVTAAAVMVAAGKRLAELRRPRAVGALSRTVLARYTVSRLTTIVFLSGAVAAFAYAMWAAALPRVGVIPWRPLTAAPFIGCLIRYGVLIRRGAGETPEDLVFGDRLLALGGIVWLALFAAGVHASA